MDGAARIPTWIDRLEGDGAVRVSALITPQELLSTRIEGAIAHVGVHAGGIAMPDIDMRTGERNARIRADARHDE